MPQLSPEQALQALDYWRRRFDTAHIACFLHVSEAAVYNSLWKIREQQRAA